MSTQSDKSNKSNKSEKSETSATAKRKIDPTATADPGSAGDPFVDERDRGPDRPGRRGPRRGGHRHDERSERGDRGERGPRGGRGGPRAKRGEVRNAVIGLLAEGPKHGYQIIQELGERSGGLWAPSPGSIYPILHRLAGAGVVEAREVEDGRRVFTLTAKGKVVAEHLAERVGVAPFTVGTPESDEVRELRRLAGQFDAAVGQVAEVATPEQLVRAAAIVAESRRRLYALLAEEPTESPTESTEA